MQEASRAEPCATIRVVAVIGAGRLGRRFALECAAAGYDVVLEDVMPVNLRRAQDEYEALGLGGARRLSVALTVEEAVVDADLAIDFVPDELESKLEIFSLMDRMAPPRTIFCTPSAALSITDLASCVYRPDRCFAVTGEMLAGGSARLLHPEGCSPFALASVQIFFRTVGVHLRVAFDSVAPVLVKNQEAIRSAPAVD